MDFVKYRNISRIFDRYRGKRGLQQLSQIRKKPYHNVKYMVQSLGENGALTMRRNAFNLEPSRGVMALASINLARENVPSVKDFKQLALAMQLGVSQPKGIH